MGGCYSKADQVQIDARKAPLMPSEKSGKIPRPTGIPQPQRVPVSPPENSGPSSSTNSQHAVTPNATSKSGSKIRQRTTPSGMHAPGRPKSLYALHSSATSPAAPESSNERGRTTSGASASDSPNCKLRSPGSKPFKGMIKRFSTPLKSGKSPDKQEQNSKHVSKLKFDVTGSGKLLPRSSQSPESPSTLLLNASNSGEGSGNPVQEASCRSTIRDIQSSVGPFLLGVKSTNNGEGSGNDVQATSSGSTTQDSQSLEGPSPLLLKATNNGEGLAKEVQATSSGSTKWRSKPSHRERDGPYTRPSPMTDSFGGQLQGSGSLGGSGSIMTSSLDEASKELSQLSGQGKAGTPGEPDTSPRSRHTPTQQLSTSTPKSGNVSSSVINRPSGVQPPGLIRPPAVKVTPTTTTASKAKATKTPNTAKRSGQPTSNDKDATARRKGQVATIREEEEALSTGSHSHLRVRGHASLSSLNSDDLMLNTEVGLDDADDDVMKDIGGTEKEDPFIVENGQVLSRSCDGELVVSRGGDGLTEDTRAFFPLDKSEGGTPTSVENVSVKRIRSVTAASPTGDATLRNFRPPRRRTISAGDDEDVPPLLLPQTEHRHMVHDVAALKLMLLRLKRLLLDDEGHLPPFLEQVGLSQQRLDSSVSEPSTPMSVISSSMEYERNRDSGLDSLPHELTQDMLHLRQENAILKSQLAERDQTIALLQRQMEDTDHVNGTLVTDPSVTHEARRTPKRPSFLPVNAAGSRLQTRRTPSSAQSSHTKKPSSS